VGFEPTISVFERAKTARVLDRAATAIGITNIARIFFKTAARYLPGTCPILKRHVTELHQNMMQPKFGSGGRPATRGLITHYKSCEALFTARLGHRAVSCRYLFTARNEDEGTAAVTVVYLSVICGTLAARRLISAPQSARTRFITRDLTTGPPGLLKYFELPVTQHNA
jgi:hypothetical protein